MNPKNIRYKKIRNIVMDCLKKKNGIDRAVLTLNRNGFTAPCGRKNFWKRSQVKKIIRGEICEPDTISMSVLVTKTIHGKIKDNNKNMSEFLRDAISEKIKRDKL